MQKKSSVKMFGGWQEQYTHDSEANNCVMTFSIYLPPQSTEKAVPVLYWLSGLTCTDENFVTKAGAQRYAAEHGIALVMPDTSPRGNDVPDDAEGAWDFGLGAGFYVDATQQPWQKNYQMYRYITQELPGLIQEHFAVTDKASIAGHSMGGHGALTIALKNPEHYLSVSAFSPIVSPLHCPWGHKALEHYLGSDQSAWQAYDTCALIENLSSNGEKEPKQFTLMVDQGLADNFLTEQLKPELLQAVCDAHNYPLVLRQHEGYDHSYYFIASFIGEHIAFHAQHLKV